MKRREEGEGERGSVQEVWSGESTLIDGQAPFPQGAIVEPIATQLAR